MFQTNQTMNIHCGVAGWSYPDWEGYVYPPNTKDKLRYVAQFVDMIEINNTFYRPPEAKTVQSWVTRTEDMPDFFFSAKLHQDITHRGLIDQQMTQAFADGLKPAIDAGKLKHLLAQFRYDFADTPANRALLQKIKEQYGNLTNLTLELRHNSWESDDAMEFLMVLDVTVANLDYPLGKTSFDLPLCDVGEHAYLRLHGRNAKAWFSKGAGRDEVYNYYYGEKEVDSIVERAIAIARTSKSLTLVTNNHYQGKEVANALQIKSKLSAQKVPVPPPLVAKYPELEKIRQQKQEA
jgi:uncharacterized protein YecE (DUF72 family)